METMIKTDQKIQLVDGELFSWYGNRLLATVDYLKHLAEVLSQKHV
mgnify:CR=1 FL=1